MTSHEPPHEFNLADIWECAADVVPHREALVVVGGPNPRRLTYGELEARSNRLAHALAARGVGAGDHVGLYLRNGTEYVEGFLAAFKLRAVPINVNYRYVTDELAYLFDDADLVALVHHAEFGGRVAEVAPKVPRLTRYLSVADGVGRAEDVAARTVAAEDYEAVLAASSPERGFGPRSGDDHYVLYTGGTTGMPKGVVWRQEDAFFACIGGGDPTRYAGVVERPEELLDRVQDTDAPFTFLPVAPLMHAAAQWTSMSWLFAGGKVILMPGSLDPDAIWRAVGDERVNLLVVVGDAVARPLLDGWDAGGGAETYDTSSLLAIGSGGAPLTPALRRRLVTTFPDLVVNDGFGSSETGAQGNRQGLTADEDDGPPRFSPLDANTLVLDDELRPVEPGSGVVGRVALRGHIPLRYHKDPDKTATTFVEADGERWVVTGDMATVEADGAIALLGRGSVCINTGGEKVFPEEVEAVLKAHDTVYDAVVVGVDDERWGQSVAAVVAAAPGATIDQDALVEHARAHLAGYKVPRSVTVVDEVVRSPVGKADYRWARAVAMP